MVAALTALCGSHFHPALALCAQDSTEDKENSDANEESESDYEKKRKANMAENDAIMALFDKVRIGMTVHIPHSVFPDEPAPEGGFWIGQTVKTNLGGTGDIGVSVPGDDIFTRPRSEVAHWVVD